MIPSRNHLCVVIARIMAMTSDDGDNDGYDDDDTDVDDDLWGRAGD